MRVFILLFSLPFVLCAQPSAKQLIAAANQRFDKVNSYSANINLNFKIPGVQLEPIAGKVFYKKPSKFRIHAKGIIFLPKQNPYYALQSVRDTNAFTAVLTGTETINGATTALVNVIPNDNNGDLILAKFWVDEAKNLVHKAQLTTKSNGTISIEQTFGSNAGFGLPDDIKFVVDMAKFKIPKAVAMELNSKAKTAKPDESKRGLGEILLKFSSFKLNERIDDTVFEEQTN